MTLLTGMTETGIEVPVQVKPDGKLVAEGLQGPPGLNGQDAEDLWDRTGTELSPKTAGDSVFTSGEVKVGGTTATPNIQLKADGKIASGGVLDLGRPERFQAGGSYLAFGDSEGYRVINTSGNIGASLVAGAGTNSNARLDLHANSFEVFSGGYIRQLVTPTGDFLLGGTLPASPNIQLKANGEVYGGAYILPAAAGNHSYIGYESGFLRAYNYTMSDGPKGVQLPIDGTAWSPVISESRLKDIQSDADTDQCWDLIRDIELKRYYYKEQADKSGVSYMGPMADWLGLQDPELLIDTGRTDEHGAIHTYNQGLLDMKALAALSAALKRIEALEAEVAALKAASTHTP